MKRLLMMLLLGGTLLMVAGGAAAQPNATWYQDPSWSFPVVPMHWQAPPAWLPLTLFGNDTITYWNAAGINNGDTAIPAGMLTVMNLDGWPTDFVTWGELPAGTPLAAMNRGPLSVRGGRHVMSVFHDAWGAVAESDESDNFWGRQFVWSGLELNNTGPVIRPEPPHPQGGWNDLSVPAVGNNCDGFWVPGDFFLDQWMAVEAHALDVTADYDLYLYDSTLIPDDAFEQPIAYSTAGAGHLDFVVLNQSQVGGFGHHAGVEKYTGTGDFAIEWIPNWYTNIGDVLPVTMAQDEFLKIWQLVVDPTQAGTMLVTADSDPGAELRLAVYDPSISVGGIFDAPVTEGSQPDGTLRLDFDFAVPGSYALVVYRHPADGNGPVDFTLQVQREAPDLAPGHLATWHSPLVPRPAADGTPQAVPLPAQLEGFSNSNYFNLAVTNNGPGTVEGISTLNYMDGLRSEIGHSFQLGMLGTCTPGGVLVANNIGPFVIPGGRHVWTMELDPDNTVLESDETNNIWGEQYVWSGWPLGYSSTVYDYVPAQMFDGLETITSGEVVWPTCNGFTLPDAPVGWWRAVSLFHAPEEDLDLFLFDPATGPKDGFDVWLVGSAMSGGYTDFIVVNENLGPPGPVDIGVFRFSEGLTGYGLEIRESTLVSQPLAAPIGPLTLHNADMLKIFDIWLDPGTYSFQLDNLSGQVDWGFQLQPADQVFSVRYSGLVGAFAAGPGQDESFQVDIIAPGWYGLVVYKSKVADQGIAGTCQVRVTTGATPAPDIPAPVRAGIAAVKPNPFNPSTEIRFELGTAGPARLEVYDVQGARVRTLLAENLPAGSHTVRWDGRDNAGRRSASGVYFARLRAQGVDSQQKMVMVK